MQLNVSRKKFTSLIILIIILMLLPIGGMIYKTYKLNEAEKQINNSYLRAIQGITENTNNIKTTLSKGIYAGTSPMLEEVSLRLIVEIRNAKTNLAQLPLDEEDAIKLNEFYSKVNNYATIISQKSSNNQKMTLEDYTGLASLYEYCDELCIQFKSIESKIKNGGYNFSDYQQPESEHYDDGVGVNNNILYVPRDNVINLSSTELSIFKNKEKISEEKAKEIVSKTTGIKFQDIDSQANINGIIPSYRFSGDKAEAIITEKGGILAYYSKNRNVNSTEISVKQATEIALSFAKNAGFCDIISTWHTIRNNVCMISFAGYEDGVTIYPDVININVALDNGEILLYNMKEYLLNYKVRDLSVGGNISVSEAEKNISPLLTVQSRNMAVINKDNKDVLVYEFRCSSRKGLNVIVFVNMKTGEEEDILIVTENETGMTVT